jgi:hypothetical protein
MENIRGKFTSDLGQNFTLSSSNLVEMRLNEARVVGFARAKTPEARSEDTEKTTNKEVNKETVETSHKTAKDKFSKTKETLNNRNELSKKLEKSFPDFANSPKNLSPNILDNFAIVEKSLKNKLDPDTEIKFPESLTSKYSSAAEVRKLLLSGQVEKSDQLFKLIDQLGINQKTFLEDSFEAFWHLDGETSYERLFEMSILNRDNGLFQKFGTLNNAQNRLYTLASMDLEKMNTKEIQEMFVVAQAIVDLQNLKKMIETIQVANEPKNINIHQDYISEMNVKLSNKKEYVSTNFDEEEESDKDEFEAIDFNEAPEVMTAITIYVAGGLDKAIKKGYIERDKNNGGKLTVVNFPSLSEDKKYNVEIPNPDSDEDENETIKESLTCDETIATVYEVLANSDGELETIFDSNNGNLTSGINTFLNSDAFNRYKPTLDQIRLDLGSNELATAKDSYLEAEKIKFNTQQQSEKIESIKKEQEFLTNMGFTKEIQDNLTTDGFPPEIIYDLDGSPQMVKIKNALNLDDSLPIYFYENKITNYSNKEITYNNNIIIKIATDAEIIQKEDQSNKNLLNSRGLTDVHLNNLHSNNIILITETNSKNKKIYKLSFVLTSNKSDDYIISKEFDLKPNETIINLSSNENSIELKTKLGSKERTTIIDILKNGDPNPTLTKTANINDTDLQKNAELKADNVRAELIASLIANPTHIGPVNEDNETITHYEKIGNGAEGLDENSTVNRKYADKAIYEKILNTAEDYELDHFNLEKMANYLSECLIFGISAIKEDPKATAKYKDQLAELDKKLLSPDLSSLTITADDLRQTEKLFQSDRKLSEFHRELIRYGLDMNETEKSQQLNDLDSLRNQMGEVQFHECMHLFAGINFSKDEIIKNLVLGGKVLHIQNDTGTAGIATYAFVDPLDLPNSGISVRASSKVGETGELSTGAGINFKGFTIGIGGKTGLDNGWFVGGDIGTIKAFGISGLGIGLGLTAGTSLENKHASIYEESLKNVPNEGPEFNKTVAEFKAKYKENNPQNNQDELWKLIENTNFAKVASKTFSYTRKLHEASDYSHLTLQQKNQICEMFYNTYVLNYEIHAYDQMQESGEAGHAFHVGYATIAGISFPYIGYTYTSLGKKVVKYVVPDSAINASGEQQKLENSIIKQFTEQQEKNGLEVVIKSKSSDVFYDKEGKLAVEKATDLSGFENLDPKDKQTQQKYIDELNKNSENIGVRFSQILAENYNDGSKEKEAANNGYIFMEFNKLFLGDSDLEIHVDPKAPNIRLLNLEKGTTASDKIRLGLHGSLNKNLIFTKRQSILSDGSSKTILTISDKRTSLTGITNEESSYLAYDHTDGQFKSVNVNTEPAQKNFDIFTESDRQAASQELLPSELSKQPYNIHADQLRQEYNRDKLTSERMSELDTIVTAIKNDKKGFHSIARLMTDNTYGKKTFQENSYEEVYKLLNNIDNFKKLAPHEQSYVMDRLFYESFTKITEMNGKKIIKQIASYKKLNRNLLLAQINKNPDLAKYNTEANKNAIFDTIEAALDRNQTKLKTELANVDGKTTKAQFQTLEQSGLELSYLLSAANAKQIIPNTVGYRQVDTNKNSELQILAGVVDKLDDSSINAENKKLTQNFLLDMYDAIPTSSDSITEDNAKKLRKSELALKVTTTVIGYKDKDQKTPIFLLPLLLKNKDLLGDKALTSTDNANSYAEIISLYLKNGNETLTTETNQTQLTLFNQLLTEIRNRQTNGQNKIQGQFENDMGGYSVEFGLLTGITNIKPCGNTTFAIRQDINFETSIPRTVLGARTENLVGARGSSATFETNSFTVGASLNLEGDDSSKKGGGEKEPPKESTATDEPDGGPIPPNPNTSKGESSDGGDY